MRGREIGRLALFIGVCLAVGAVAGALTASSVSTWYAEIQKPAWTPPGAIFGPVWTILYVMIGTAGWLVHRTPPSAGKRAAMALWWTQLGLNFLWSPIFFLLRAPGTALVEIVLLWCALVAFAAVATRVRPSAAVLFLPYGVWVTFATALNAAIWRLNP